MRSMRSRATVSTTCSRNARLARPGLLVGDQVVDAAALVVDAVLDARSRSARRSTVGPRSASRTASTMLMFGSPSTRTGDSRSGVEHVRDKRAQPLSERHADHPGADPVDLHAVGVEAVLDGVRGPLERVAGRAADARRVLLGGQQVAARRRVEDLRRRLLRRRRDRHVARAVEVDRAVVGAVAGLRLRDRGLDRGAGSGRDSRDAAGTTTGACTRAAAGWRRCPTARWVARRRTAAASPRAGRGCSSVRRCC